MTYFTRTELSAALNELGKLALDAGKVIDLALYGGSCLTLVSNFRVGSEDVDAVAIADQDFIDRAARTIAGRHGWPGDWLNDGVRAYLSPAVVGHDSHELFATYPEEAKPGLRVFVPNANYMLAMKLMALRIEAIDEKDFNDILNLMQVVGLKEKAEVVDFAAQFYPEARVSGKLRLALDNLWSAYQAQLKRQEHESPRYLGRSSTSR
jgi:hypothetical protein